MSEEQKIAALSEGGNYYYTNLSHGEYYGVHFAVTGKICEFHTECGLHSVHGGSITLSIYQWHGSCKASMSTEPIASHRYNLFDGNVLALRFKPQKPGEYFAVLHKASGGAGFCGNFIDFPGTELYLNGFKITGSMKASVIFCEGDNGDLKKVHPGNDEHVPKKTDDTPERRVNPDNWVMTDGLSREIKNDFRTEKKKKVGMFYWDWHYFFSHNKPVNLNNLIEKYPQASNDGEHFIWQQENVESYFWNKPLFGYYDNRDGYVAEKHAELLGEAGVDFIAFDCTNGSFTWRDAYLPIFEAFDRAQKRGVNVPKIVFMLGFCVSPDTRVEYQRVYTDIYKKGLFKNLWFIHEGKPLIIGRYDSLDPETPIDREILAFFTHRKNDPNYFSAGTDSQGDWWGWLSVSPQPLYGKREDGSCEMMTVSVAQNANKTQLCAMNDPRGGVRGRSYSTDKKYRAAFPTRNGTLYKSAGECDSVLFGINYQEQFDRVFLEDPDIIFITGFNEWVASRAPEWQGTKNAFPDEFTDEYSRDIEPTEGKLRDYYYTQTVYNIRKFKGCSPDGDKLYDFGAPSDIKPDSPLFEKAEAEYFYSDSYPVRSHSGWKGEYYISPVPSNIVVAAKTARDDENLYILAVTKDRVIKNDLKLLIADRGAGAGYEGFNYLLGRVEHAGGTVSFEKMTEDENTGKAALQRTATCEVSVKANRVLFKIPVSLFSSNEISYKIFNSASPEKDILSLYKYGCCVPGGRFALPVKLS